MVAVNVIAGAKWGQATEFPAGYVPMVFEGLAWREIGSQSPLCTSLLANFGRRQYREAV
jgi:hypothetical protein